MINQGDKSNVDWDYKRRGYSERSLEMLTSEEGQLNAIFACYGSAAHHGQLFEEALVKLTTLLGGCLGSAIPHIELKKKTIGQLLRLFETRYVDEIDNWVPDFLDEARDRRNFLIHKYFLIRAHQMDVESGRLSMLKELFSIEAQLHRSAELVNGLRVAVEEAINGPHEENQDRNVVFSVRLRTERN